MVLFANLQVSKQTVLRSDPRQFSPGGFLGVSMSTVVTSIAPVAPVISLDAAREALVGGIAKTGELIINYATALNQAFDLLDNQGNVTTKWFDLKGKLAAPVKAEREKCKAAFASRGIETASFDVYWGRIKDAAGRVKTQNRVAGGNDPEALNLSDLKTIINRIFKMEEDGKDSDWSDHKKALMDVYEDMGGDSSKLG